MIETITLRNYKGHTETVVPCQRLTVLVGENAAGKTSVLEAIATVHSCLLDPQHIARRALYARIRKGADEGSSIQITATDGERRGTLGISISFLDVLSRVMEIGSKPGVVLSDKDDVPPGSRLLLMFMLPAPVWLALDPHQLARPSKPENIDPRPDPNGYGLASALAHLKLSDTARFERIVDNLRAVVPVVKDIRFRRVERLDNVPRAVRVEDKLIEMQESVKTIADALLFDFVDAKDVSAELVSEGTLLTLGIFTALEYDQLPQIVLIDDIDRALHPRAQRALITTLRSILGVMPNLQVIATSHSPYLVDALKPEEVVILGRNAQNVITAKRLDSFPDGRLREMLSTGELWMSEGESWVKQ